KAVLGGRSSVDWDAMAADYDRIRDAIERVVPGFEDYNERIRRPGGFYLPNPPRERVFPTPTGKAVFTAHPLRRVELPDGRLFLTTIRSHDQFNTTIYGLDDRYRGVSGGRRVIFMNDGDIERFGLAAGDLVDITSHFDDGERSVKGFAVVPYDIPPDCAAAYFPEANPLFPLGSFAKRSFTPTSKRIIVSVARARRGDRETGETGETASDAEDAPVHSLTSARKILLMNLVLDKFHEECGIFGIFGHPEASTLTQLGLFAQQHRGQEACGIVSSDGRDLYQYRSQGLIADVLTEDVLNRLVGAAAIGHTRYSTSGRNTIKEVQPFLVTCQHGQIAVCHNGNLPFAGQKRQELEAAGAIFSSTSDTETLLHGIARTKAANVVEAIESVLKDTEGAFSLLFLTPKALIAVRDPRGFRPMVLGKLKDAWCVASETVAFDLIDAEYVREVEPG